MLCIKQQRSGVDLTFRSLPMNNTKHVSNAMGRLIRGREAAREAARKALDTVGMVTKAKEKAPTDAVAVARREAALPIPTDDTRPNA